MWQFWVFCLILLSCSPRFTSRKPTLDYPYQPRVAPKQVYSEAFESYEKGVDLFVDGDFDSASLYFDLAVSLLTSDIEWSEDAQIADQRRILLYKCRYYLERMPTEVHEVVELEGVEAIKPPLPPIEIECNSRVQKWLDYFTGAGRGRFTEWLERCSRYRHQTLKVLREEGLPEDLINLALIESGFNPNAYSRAHAVGVWQFIKSTAVIYGLRVDSWVDERRDPIRSARAAARHLRDLYEIFDSWPLALAAYNCGRKNVERAMARAHTKDFWKLALKRETSEYVPQFMAACLITRDLEKYGFKVSYATPMVFEEIEVEPRTDLRAVAKGCGVSPEVIFDLNPHLVRKCVPPGVAKYSVRVPEGLGDKCLIALSNMPEQEKIVKELPASYIKHTVRSGETLGSIARKYSTTTSALAKANGISTRQKLKVGQVLLVPSENPLPEPSVPGIHVVRRGETLSGIAVAYGLKVGDLVAWNGLQSADRIYPGQRLRISKATSVASSGQTKSSSRQSVDCDPSGLPEVYVVKKGDTLSKIANRYGVGVQQICNLNNLSPQSVIYPGQRIKVPGLKAADSVIHEVKKGESVSSISRTYGTSVQSVLEANNLKPSQNIYPGQRLSIPVGSNIDPEKVHIVKKGESITRIAKAYGVSPNLILKANGLKPDDLIHPGQKIKIP